MWPRTLSLSHISAYRLRLILLLTFKLLQSNSSLICNPKPNLLHAFGLCVEDAVEGCVVLFYPDSLHYNGSKEQANHANLGKTTRDAMNKHPLFPVEDGPSTKPMHGTKHIVEDV
jgi:hypothetical protein